MEGGLRTWNCVMILRLKMDKKVKMQWTGVSVWGALDDVPPVPTVRIQAGIKALYRNTQPGRRGDSCRCLWVCDPDSDAGWPNSVAGPCAAPELPSRVGKAWLVETSTLLASSATPSNAPQPPHCPSSYHTPVDPRKTSNVTIDNLQQQ
jgi:hypothetical protein